MIHACIVENIFMRYKQGTSTYLAQNHQKNPILYRLYYYACNVNTVPKASANIFWKSAETLNTHLASGKGQTRPALLKEMSLGRPVSESRAREKIRERKRERKAVRSETYSKVVGSFVLPQGGTNSAGRARKPHSSFGQRATWKSF